MLGLENTNIEHDLTMWFNFDVWFNGGRFFFFLAGTYRKSLENYYFERSSVLQSIFQGHPQ